MPAATKELKMRLSVQILLVGSIHQQQHCSINNNNNENKASILLDVAIAITPEIAGIAVVARM